MSEATRRFLVSGVVQGVFFRASTEQKARELHVAGWVRNLTDGRVEVVACAPAARLELFERWLWSGPERAQVLSVERSDFPPDEFNGFSVETTASAPAP